MAHATAQRYPSAVRTRFVPLAFVLFAAAAVGADTPPASTAAPPASTAGSVKLYPLSPIGQKGPSDTCDSDACKALLDLIRGAKVKIDFAVYGLRGQTAIFDALADAKRRGIVMRGIVDKDDKDMTYYADTDKLIATIGTVKTDHLHDREKAADQDEYDMADDRCPRPPGFLGPLQCVGYDLGDSCLISSQASIEQLSYDGDIMHDKFFVIDDRYVWTGSANVSDSDITGYSANVVVVLDSPGIAAQYTHELDQMYDQGLFHEDKVAATPQRIQVGDSWVTAYFPPAPGPMDELRYEVQHAKERIDISIFYLTHKQLAGDLIQAHLRGVKVRVIVDATSAKNGYSKHELLRAAGIPVKVENWGGKMHAKACIIDDDVLFAGSMNWTSAGVKDNDENYLKIENRGLVSQYERWYESLWNAIPDKWLTGRPDPESQDSGVACTDKSDNDFDGKKDADDPGCGPNPPPEDPLPPFEIVKKEDGHGLIKGNVTSEGKRTYHIALGQYYDSIRIDDTEGDRWFCSEDDARAAGFRRSSK
jgi:phosphatidylserine/phosphatidylglycerophosphate/cardiolipin synthase-like enzyme